LGLGHQFTEVKEKYKEANEILGDIIKVTPSSKMVGDLAIFMVQNNLTKDNIVEKGRSLTFPDSVVTYFKGLMGQPMGGFPKELQEVVLKGEEPITCRPGELLPPVDFEAVKEKLKNELGVEPDMKMVLSYCLYPRVLVDFIKHREEFSNISRMDTHVFFQGLAPGETTELTIEDGKTLIIKFIGLGELNDDGTRNVIFELNGMRREITIPENNAQSKTAAVKLADPNDKHQVSASIPGTVFKILVKEGQEVEENEGLLIIEAMKMETKIVARTKGTVESILVKEGSQVKAGELIMQLK
jgi:pyruvate carboxylase